MTEVNGSDQFLNVKNQTFNSPATCTGPSPSKTIQITTFSVIIILSLIGNVLVLAAFISNKHLRTSTHYLIVNMAVSDLLIPTITLPVWIASIYYDGLWFVGGVVGTILCKVVENTWNVSTFVSIFSMSAIAADRFHAVLFPMKSALFSRNKCRVMIAAIWIASVAFHAHYIYATKPVSYDTRVYCYFQWDPASQTLEVAKITWILFVCLTSVSAIVLTVLYSSILITLNRQKKNLNLTSELVKSRSKENRKITCMLVVVVIIFYVAWIPHQVLYYVIYFKPSKRLPCFYTSFGSILPALCPVANPMVYCTFNDTYRQYSRELLCCLWRCDKCNDCLHQSAPPQGKGHVYSVEQMNIVNEDNENIELQEKR